MSHNVRSADDTVAASRPRAVSPLPLLIGLLAGPILWSLHILVSEVVVSSVCSADSRVARLGVGGASGRQIVLLGVSLGFILAVLAVDAVALGSWRHSRIGIEVTGASGGAAGRSGWMALAGVLLSSLFLIGILFAAVPLFWLSGCGG